ncbi:hypothetical protein Tco_1214813 [Tanacetum coccineum]
MIKEHDRQTKIKTTRRKLIYADSKREASDELMARRFSDRLSLESSDTSDTRGKAHSASKIELKKEPEGRNPRPEEGGPNIKKQVPTLSTRKDHPFQIPYEAKLHRNIRVYEGNKDPEDHLSIFSAEVEQEEWLMPIWCKMFYQNLGGAARNWFDDLDPKSVDSFEELRQSSWKNFHSKKDTPKTP